VHLCNNTTIHEMKYSFLQAAELVVTNYVFGL